MTLQEFFNKYNGKGVDLLSTVKRAGKWFVSFLKGGVFIVNTGMVGTAGYFKIFYSIIKMVVVLVVDYFPRFEFSTKMLLKHLSVPPSFPVGVVVNRLLHVFNLAVLATKNSLSPLVAFEVNKWFSTLVTNKHSNPGLVVAPTIAKSSPLRRRGAENRFTYFADVLHRPILTSSVLRLQV